MFLSLYVPISFHVCHTRSFPYELFTAHFAHAAMVVGNGKLSPSQVDILMHLLDRDGDGVVTTSDVRWWASEHTQVESDKPVIDSWFSSVNSFLDCVQSPANN